MSTKDNHNLIEQIAKRAVSIFVKADVPVTQLEIMMDIQATHEACPLDLNGLLAADDFNFTHDVGGIRRHLNRSTRRLENCFLPRFRQKEPIQ